MGRIPAQLDTSSAFGTYRRHTLRRLVWQMCDAPIFSAATRRLLRKKIARKLTGPYDVEFDHINWRLYPEENHCDRVIFARHSLPEKAEHEALLPHIKPGMSFVDIGANVGSYSLFIARYSGSRAHILALEPHPRTIQKLRYNLVANGVDDAKVLQLACGPERTTMKLWSDGGSNIGHTSILKEGTANAKISVDVEIVPLVDILGEQNIGKIDLLKIDIEGFEDQALMPFFENAGKLQWPGLVLIETAHQSLWKHDVIGWMRDAGYKTVFETTENVVLQFEK